MTPIGLEAVKSVPNPRPRSGGIVHTMNNFPVNDAYVLTMAITPVPSFRVDDCT